MVQEPLQLLTDLYDIRDAFSVWRNAMEQHGERLASVWRLSIGKIYFRRNGNDNKLGLDPTGDHWTVELNEPEQGTENPLSGVARDSAGQRYLLRQGTLHKNAQSARIESPDFEERTGLRPATVTIEGKPAKRAWFIVTALDRPAAEICQNTAAFVLRCGIARSPDAAATAKQDDKRLVELFGPPEKGGKIAGQPTVSREERWRIHGEVWQKLKGLFDADGRELVKPLHAYGYEVDGVVEAQAGKLLLEIKTGVAAADVYEGIGQLTLYPRLLPRLSGHRRILLLPGSPSIPLVAAVRECGVELHCYSFQRDGEKVDVCFSPQFLKLCDLGL
ncbi:hypothetical protein [Bradyrhizobium sp. 153]|uniref:hypothetical protein n=1 Tax=Bradyrhizobium sp. 153 TaxID=2782627 RepID=UPI001FFBA65A|nr:hypothetical protein [Bradyrhizobium sp. 153]MCK1666162.1 hypothetical protein [Bradyrhizobium sp. 153]